jgi:hypothetical protein
MTTLSTVETIRSIRQCGVTLTVRAGRLKARPIGAVPPDLAVAAAEHRAEIIAVLQSEVREAEIDRLAAADGWSGCHGRHAEDADVVNQVRATFADAKLLAIVRQGAAGSFDNLEALDAKPIGERCQVCRGKCRWCQTPGILRCGDRSKGTGCESGKPVL